MTLENRIARGAEALRRLVEWLRDRGYRFASPGAALPGPEAGTSVAIARLEHEVGPVPLAVKLFWQHIGSVDLCGDHAEWTGCDLPDPLVVYPPSVALAELDDFMSDRQERLRVAFPFSIPVAPDALHKANLSGGMWVSVSVPAVADDPPLNDAGHDSTFLGVLENAIQWGGFPGLSSCAAHSWPIDELRRASNAGG